MSESKQNSSGIDKDFLYGRFQKNADWQQKLAKKASYKALDMAEDDVKIESNRHGLSGGAVALIVAAAGLGPLILAGMMLLKQPAVSLSTPSKQAQQVIDNTVEKDINIKSYFVPKE